jgi:hypothetical protein
MLWRYSRHPWLVRRLETSCLLPFQGARRSIVTYKVDRLLRKAPDDAVIRVQGTIRTVRKQKHQAFAAITDGSSPRKLQALLSPEQAAPWVRDDHRTILC